MYDDVHIIGHYYYYYYEHGYAIGIDSIQSMAIGTYLHSLFQNSYSQYIHQPKHCLHLTIQYVHSLI